MTLAAINDINQQIKDLIEDGATRQALRELRNFAANRGLEDRVNEAIQLSSRHTENESEALAGVKTEQEVKIERNKIVRFALHLLQNTCEDAAEKIREVEASEKQRASREIEMVLQGARVLDDLHLAKIIEKADEFKLEELDLSGKSIGYLPIDIAKLQHLKKLNLSRNLFTELPAFLGKLSALAVLDVSHNQIKELPCELGDLIDLEELIIEENPISDPPPDVLLKGTDSILRFLARKSKSKQKNRDDIFEELKINQLVTAVVFDKQEYGLFLSYRGLEGLLHKNYISKDKLKELENVKIGTEIEVVVNTKLMLNGRRRLSFATQYLEGDNSRIAAKNLADNMIDQAVKDESTILDLSKLGLESLSSDIGKCVNLEVLYLNNNRLPSLPDEICNLFRLKKLYLQNNYLKKLPEEIGRLEQLEILWLENNKLAKLPASLVKLDKLKEIAIKNNPCTVNLPDEDVKKIKVAIAESLLNIGKNELHYSSFAPGEVLLGQVKLIYNYGVFVRVVKNGDYKEGLLHKSETTIDGKDYWRTLNKFFQIGDLLEVRIQDIQQDNNRVTFALHDSFPTFIMNKVFNRINYAKKNRSTRLDLSYAGLTTLPDEIGELEYLEELDLRFNPLKVLPPAIKQLGNLKVILIDSHAQNISAQDVDGVIDYFMDI